MQPSDYLSPTYLPTSPDEFLGVARSHAMTLQRMVAGAAASGNLRPLIANGVPGTGKTMLGKFLRHLLGVSKWSINGGLGGGQAINGTSLNLDKVKELAALLHASSMFDRWKLIHIDEVDGILKSPAAQLALLTVLDEVPPFTAFYCTSNCRLDDFEERFHTRFIPFEFGGRDAAGKIISPVPQDELERFLGRWPLRPADLKQIATFACGNVRQAILDTARTLVSYPA